MLPAKGAKRLLIAFKSIHLQPVNAQTWVKEVIRAEQRSAVHDEGPEAILLRAFDNSGGTFCD